MARSQGFAIGDFDTSFPLDDKVLDLAARAGSRPLYYQAVGVYFHVFGAAWRDGERKTAARLAPGASPRAVALLIEVGLLDADGMLPAKSFENWVGRALEHRRNATDRQRKSRYERDGAVTAPPVTDSHAQSQASRAGQGRTGKDATGKDASTEEEVQGEKPDALDTYWQIAGTYPAGRAKAWIEELAAEFGDEATSRALGAEASGEPKGLLGRVQSRLRHDAHETAAIAKQREADRLTEWNREHKLTPEQVAENKRRTDELIRSWIPKEAT